MYVDPDGEFVWFAPIIWAADLIKIFSENTNYYIIDNIIPPAVWTVFCKK